MSYVRLVAYRVGVILLSVATLATIAGWLGDGPR